ncbi:hypothetical protein A374_07131 [Fictibacillus macauensis ZFHKF-1]|uniref:Uncharacterized protein n=1 Tax=Fictibacillus macauensis ZFHKF-1 TaxID=1196324 RepID=I8AKI5_9BACL|nr:hypothetical protein [Fictibacillus macauensis]EIT86074.1 hypothetical protein A374_07131 [Fictibacillus macauensis ZFHKF-1]
MIPLLRNFADQLIEENTQARSLAFATNILKNDPHLPDGYIARFLYHYHFNETSEGNYWKEEAIAHGLLKDEELVHFVIEYLNQPENALFLYPKLNLMQQAFESDPTNPEYAKYEAAIYLKKAQKAFQKFRFKQARADWAEAYAINSLDHSLYWGQSHIYPTKHVYLAFLQIFYILFMRVLQVVVKVPINRFIYTNHTGTFVIRAYLIFPIFSLYCLFYWFGLNTFFILIGIVLLIIFTVKYQRAVTRSITLPLRYMYSQPLPKDPTDKVPSWDFKKK